MRTNSRPGAEYHPEPRAKTDPRPRRRGDRVARRKWNRVALYAGIGLLVVVASIVGWSMWKYNRISNNVKLDPVQSQEVRDALDQAPSGSANDSIQYILFLGGDMRPGQTTGRSDTIMVARVDTKRGRMNMLSIPRDSRVAIPGRGVGKINSALAFGGPALAIKTVKAYTGLPITHFVLVNFRGFADIVDAMGGVEIKVDAAINDKHGANSGGVSNVTRIPAGLQRLNGQQSLTYVRCRQYPDGDFTRIRHQQTFLKALFRQALDAGQIDKLPKIAEVASGNMKTDMDMLTLSRLARLLKNVDQDKMVGVTLPGKSARVGGVSYVVCDEDAKKRVVADFRRGKITKKAKSGGK